MRRVLLISLLGLSLCGCGVIDVLFPGLLDQKNKDTGAVGLKPFESEEELVTYFGDQAETRGNRLATIDGFRTFDAVSEVAGAADGAFDSASPPAVMADGGSADTSVSDASRFSQTTEQEEGVAEADVVKTDGAYLYVMAGESLKIIHAVPSQELTLLSEVSLGGFGREIYLRGDIVVALTSTFGGFFAVDGPFMLSEGGASTDANGVSSGMSEGVAGAVSSTVVDGSSSGDSAFVETDVEPGFVPEFKFEQPTSRVTIISVADRANPQVISTTTFDGSTSDSRMIDGVLHLVLANFQNTYLSIMPAIGTPEFDKTSIEADTILPRFESTDADGNESSGQVVTWENLYRPEDPDGFGIVTVVSVDIDAGGSFSAVGVVAEPGLVYSSREALYLTDTNFDFFGNTREMTDVYKLAYTDRGALPAAVGSVPGRILNQYSMGEYEGFLRVATTVGPTFTAFNQTDSTNQVIVLQQQEDTLSIVGSVGGLAPRETIQSARFIGDRGYVVTFEQIDPLFTLDLSDPTNPQVIGELKVPGFSTFLVPMDADHILAVGQYIPDEFFGNRGVQLSIFDVSDFSNPTLQHNVILGENSGAQSEALFNPKAFTYFVEEGLVALPLSIFEERFFFALDNELAAGPSDADTGSPDVVAPLPDSQAGGSTTAQVVEGATPSDAPPSDIVSPDETIAGDSFEGLVVFRASVQDGFSELGRLSTRFDNANFFYSSFTRGVFIGDSVYAVTDVGVREALVDDPATITRELLLRDTKEIAAAPDGRFIP